MGRWKTPRTYTATIKGVTQTLTADDWSKTAYCQQHHISAPLIRGRVQALGWSDQDAVETLPIHPSDKAKYRINGIKARHAQEKHDEMYIATRTPGIAEDVFRRKFRATCADFGINWRECV